jgi:hypothetical protein
LGRAHIADSNDDAIRLVTRTNFYPKNRSAPSPKKSPENLKAKRVDAEIGFGSK